MIYFDHAATSFPKPKEVGEAMLAAVNEYGANPGRGGHALSERAAATITKTRNELAAFFYAPAGKHVWFYQNATMALNQAILGFPFEEGQHVVTTAFEHNSVLRPLNRLVEEKRIDVTYVEPNEEGFISVNDLKMVMTEQTKMLVVTHASNVTGAMIDLKKVAEMAKQYGAILLVDASQTAGTVPINMEELGIDLLAFAGHKSMLGPQGIAVLMSREDYQLKPLITGGTGRDSELPGQPVTWPERYEAGTLNTPGVAGLLAGLEFIKQESLKKIYTHEQNLLRICLEGLAAISNITIYSPKQGNEQMAVVSFRIENIGSHEVAMILDQHYQICVRAGLHCAPRTHHSLASIDTGLIRASFGPYNTEDEVYTFIDAIKQIASAF
ncbi:aminotransferase class V-fold PLP-dependent enzyme [Alkalihalobacillus pseudalcaliphilus]|uniref:aminotransferase class V-fold PLP-dependent enzyme n=1 Tax=Alkalihalobacillus pseudalcaliphilus TaxID=79884 RepID=UPI00064DA45D|nr:aminotransferase class V-fold PLP-dependent enzyme [Alkalihalobacillus pseudalcaliphilus]KMK77904.1 cysteine desulfurase [Alkalihalobacillus pseudalcaliphilus]